MTLERISNLFVLILLIEMMVTVGLGVSIRDALSVFSRIGLVVLAGVANYLLVPAIAMLLLYLYQTPTLVAVGILLVAVCPGAPFGPPLAALAKGNVHISVGLMVILAASSAVLAPVLLSLLLPYVARDAGLKIDTVKIVTTLLMTQLFPLGIGLFIRAKRPQLADKLLKPGNLLTGMLSIGVFGLIIALQFRTLADIRLKSYAGICGFVLLSLAAGFLCGGRKAGARRAVGFTTAARNVGVALVIATASFPQTSAVTSVIVFAVAQTILLAVIALGLGRLSADTKVAGTEESLA